MGGWGGRGGGGITYKIYGNVTAKLTVKRDLVGTDPLSVRGEGVGQMIYSCLQHMVALSMEVSGTWYIQ